MLFFVEVPAFQGDPCLLEKGKHAMPCRGVLVADLLC